MEIIPIQIGLLIMEVRIRNYFYYLKYFLFVLVTRGYLPRSILIPLSSNDQSDHLFPNPPTPIPRDISVSSRAPLPLPRKNLKSNYDQLRNVLARSNTEPCLINSLHHLKEQNERIYLNQIDCQQAMSEIIESHQYASIDPDESTPSKSNEHEQVSIKKYSLLIIFSFI
jgi:hypothetical protein